MGRATTTLDDFFTEAHFLSLPWHRSEEKRFLVESSSHSVTASTQIFPSPHSVEMVPVCSTICNGSFSAAHAATKKPRTKKATKLPKSTSPRKKARKSAGMPSSQETWASTINIGTHIAFHCDACSGPPLFYQDRTPFLHSRDCLFLGEVEYLDTVESSSAADASSSLSREVPSGIRPIGRELTCLPACTLESSMASPMPKANSTPKKTPFREKKHMLDKNESYMRKPVKRMTRGSGSADWDREYAPTRLCQRFKGGRKVHPHLLLYLAMDRLSVLLIRLEIIKCQ